MTAARVTTQREEAALRREASAQLGRGITWDEWESLCLHGDVEEALSHEREVGARDIADAVRSMSARAARRAAEAPTDAPREPRGNGPDFWRLASEVIAEAARQDENPAELREIIGLDAPLELSDAVSWIRDQAEASRPRWKAEVEAHAHDESWQGWPRTLTYLVPGQRWAPTIVCGYEQVLAEPLDILAVRSRSAAERYGWLTAHATAFLLSDFTPWAAPIRTSWSGVRPGARPPLITLTIDPRAATQDVAAAFVSARQGIISRTHRKKPQPQQEVGLKLALFALRSPEGEPASESLARWNIENPDHRRPATKAGAANFGRDLRKATARALGRDWWS